MRDFLTELGIKEKNFGASAGGFFETGGDWLDVISPIDGEVIAQVKQASEADYERVIADPAAEPRRLLDYLQLDWEDRCLEFHRHSGPAATARAAQGRQPIYSSSVGLWRRYERQLTPLAAKLREQGIDVDRY